jgi:hypothetical protein
LCRKLFKIPYACPYPPNKFLNKKEFSFKKSCIRLEKENWVGYHYLNWGSLFLNKENWLNSHDAPFFTKNGCVGFLVQVWDLLIIDEI